MKRNQKRNHYSIQDTVLKIIFITFILSILFQIFMETKHKITIPKPCHEDWNKMTPDETGRFCNSCSKSVVDFTQMLPIEIQDFFVSNQNKNVCGRFKNTQLDSIVIQIPSRVLYAQIHYPKMFLLALFIAMGTTLFSCKQENGDKQKIEKVEVVEDTLEINNITVGLRLPPKTDPNDTLHYSIPPPPPPKVDQVKFVKPQRKPQIIHLETTTGKVKIEESIEVDPLKKIDSIKLKKPIVRPEDKKEISPDEIPLIKS